MPTASPTTSSRSDVAAVRLRVRPDTESGRPRIDSILERVDLVELLERRGVQLRRDGPRLKACCPIHDERTPSFTVYIEQQPRKWWCFGCNRGGEVIDLVCELDGLDKSQAINLLSDPTMDTPTPTSSTHAEPTGPPPIDRDELNDYLERAHQALLSDKRAGKARKYLRQRGVSGDEVRHYKLGWGLPDAPDRLRGLRKRVVFPCAPWGAEGRTVTASDPKYRTVGEKHSWGLDGLDPTEPLVLVEGPLDRIALERAEQPALALRGKTIRRDDAQLLAEHGFNRVYVWLDADTTADDLDRLIRQLGEVGIVAEFVAGLSDGRDPGDLLTVDEDSLYTAIYHEGLARPLPSAPPAETTDTADTGPRCATCGQPSTATERDGTERCNRHASWNQP